MKFRHIKKKPKKYGHVHLSGRQSFIKDETPSLFTFATQTMFITGLVSIDQVSIVEFIHSLLY